MAPHAQPSCSNPLPEQKEESKPAKTIEEAFTSQPNTNLPRVLLNPDQPLERTWRFLSNRTRSGRNYLDEYGDLPAELRATLADSGAFLGGDDGAVSTQTEAELLRKWERPGVNPAAKPFWPRGILQRPVVGSWLGGRSASERVTMAGRASSRVEERVEGTGYESDLMAFVKVKRKGVQRRDSGAE